MLIGFTPAAGGLGAVPALVGAAGGPGGVASATLAGVGASGAALFRLSAICFRTRVDSADSERGRTSTCRAFGSVPSFFFAVGLPLWSPVGRGLGMPGIALSSMPWWA